MTEDDKELVERLRHCSENCRDEYLHELSGRSADRIEALSAENERLREIVVNYVDPCNVRPDDQAFVDAIQRTALGETE